MMFSRPLPTRLALPNRLALSIGLAVLMFGLGLRSVQLATARPLVADCSAERAAAAKAEPGFVALAGSGNPACY